jgi:carbazole 1,9a-dioxygenase terminal dioxygenase component
MKNETFNESELNDIEGTDEIVEKIERKKPYQKYIDAELGLRNHWYASFFSSELEEGKIRGEMICGERIVFKKVEGKVYAMEDRCPHRGAAFTARPECYSKNSVTCWLHGFTFDVRNGDLIQILSEPESKLIGKLKHKTYSVEERNNVVFVFIGDIAPPPPVEEDIQPKFLTENLVCHHVARNRVKGNWRVAAENGYDAAHLYAHRNSGMFELVDVPVPLCTFPSNKNEVIVVDEEKGPWGIIKYDDVNIWYADVEGNPVTAANVTPGQDYENWDIVVALYMPCGLEVDYFPVPDVLHFEWYTPIDEHHHIYMIAHAAICETDTEADAFRKRCDEELAPLVWRQDSGQTEPVGDSQSWGFNNFDAWGREQIHHVYQNENFWHRERLFRPDYVVIRWRMLVAKRMRGRQEWGDWAPVEGWSPDGNNYDPALGPV